MSLTTYTGIIGVILAGIAIGAWVGGRAADVYGPIGLLSSQALLGFAFAVALAALLLHPQSRDYQRIWFS